MISVGDVKRLTTCCAAFLVLLGALSGPSAAAETSIVHAPSGRASSLAFRDDNEREALFRQIARTLSRLGERDLPAGQRLEVTILDMRPAGMFEPWRPGGDRVRVLRDVTPPRVRLRYALKERGRKLVSGEETVSDINYLWNVSARASAGSFPYETELMRDWFRDRIVRRRPQRG